MKKKTTKKLWGGRFKRDVDPMFFEFQKSLYYDYLLAEFDVYHSLIHVGALRQAKILSVVDYQKLAKALDGILKKIKDGTFSIDIDSEDIHTEIQRQVEKNVGALAAKLHTLRSRNDQVVFDQKCYCSREAASLTGLLAQLVEAFTALGKKYKDVALPGYTHTQRAQVIPFVQYTCSWQWMFYRDAAKLKRFVDSLVISVGSGALAGSSLSKAAYAQAIGQFTKRYKINDLKIKPVVNSVDNVSNRDFVIEFLGVLSLIQMHLSRLAEDIIVYSTKEFDFFDLPEEFCTGSSLMPHKKNPDFLEIVRGYTGSVYGSLLSVLTTMKGLPLSYNRDMQLDKEPLFASVAIVREELSIVARLIKKITLNHEALSRALEDESLYATELAEFLVYEGVPFKAAHDIVGQLVRHSHDSGVSILEMSTTFLKSFHKSLTPAVVAKVMNPHYAIRSKKSASNVVPKIP